MRQNYIRELTKAIHMKEKGLVASSQRFYHLTKLMDAMHDVGNFTYFIHALIRLLLLYWIKPQMWNVSCVTDSEEDQSVLSEHLHPSRFYESGVSRDDDRGHCLPASQGPGRHGETPLVPQVTITAQTSHLCLTDWIIEPSFTGCFIVRAFATKLYEIIFKV